MIARRTLLLAPLPLLAAPPRRPTPLSPQAKTEDWPGFLGPRHNGTSLETKLKPRFPAGGPPLLWELPKGTGYSSPAIVGDRLVFLHRQGANEVVECLHPETGERYWQHAYPTAFEDRYGYNNGPRSSPVIVGARVFTIGAEGKLHCLELASGKVVWKRDLLAEYKVPQDFFGVASTPLAWQDRLIINVGAPGGPTVIALEQTTGKQIWGAGKEWGASYASPIPATIHGQPRVLVLAGGESRPPTGGLLCLDPRNGKCLLPGRHRQPDLHLGQLQNRRRPARNHPGLPAQTPVDHPRVRPPLQHPHPPGRLSLRLRWTQRTRCLARLPRTQNR